jgi:hypothetical protein
MRLLLVCFVLTACNNGNNSDGMMMGDDEPPADAPPPGGNVTPQVGAWSYSQVTPVSSTCPASFGNGTGNFGIDSSSTTGFHVVPNDGTAPFNCTLAGKSFNCPDRAASHQDLRPGVDAVLDGRAIASGTFASNTQASGRQELTVACAGTQCGVTGATFPCKITVDFVVRAQ